MVVIYILLFLLSLIIIKATYRTLFVPATIMASCWCIFPAFASIGVLGIYNFSWKTHTYIILSYLTFLITSILIKNMPDKSIDEKAIERLDDKKCVVKYKLILIGNIIIAFWLSTKLGDALAIIAENGFVGLRNIYENILEDTITNIIYNWFAKPFVAASCAIFCIDVLQGRKKQQVLVGIAILINIALDTIVFAARATIVKMILYIFFAIFFCRIRKIPKKQIIAILAITIILFMLVVFMTDERMSVGNLSKFSLLDSVYMYYVAPFGLLNYYVENPTFSMLGWDNNLLFGSGTFGAIYNIIRSALYIVFGTEYNGSDYIIQLVTQQTLRVGSGVSINSASTAAYIFLRDFGVIGLTFGFTLMALLAEYCRKKYFLNPSIRMGAIYVIVIYAIFRLSVTYDFLTPATFFSILFVILFTRNVKRNVNYDDA